MPLTSPPFSALQCARGVRGLGRIGSGAARRSRHGLVWRLAVVERTGGARDVPPDVQYVYAARGLWGEPCFLRMGRLMKPMRCAPWERDVRSGSSDWVPLRRAGYVRTYAGRVGRPAGLFLRPLARTVQWQRQHGHCPAVARRYLVDRVVSRDRDKEETVRTAGPQLTYGDQTQDYPLLLA
jgi:hypothetical protein